MARPGLDVRAPEVAQVVKELDASRRNLNKELRREHKAIADDIAVKINRRAAAEGYGRFAGLWAGTGTIAGAKLFLRNKPGAMARYAGTRPLTRTGWNASRYNKAGVRLGGRRYIAPDRRQARPWVGKSWIVGQPGEGPHVVRDVAPAETPHIADRYRDAFQRATSKVWGNP